MIAYIIRRLLGVIPVMLVVGIFVFSLLHLAPGDPAAIIAGDNATEENIARIRTSLGLDQPFLVQFGRWGLGVLQGDLGESMRIKKPVSELVAEKLPVTLQLATMAMAFALLIGIPAGIIVIDELLKIFSEVRRMRGKRRDEDEAPAVFARTDSPRARDLELMTSHTTTRTLDLRHTV